MTTDQQPLAFIYDRHATDTTAVLDLRVEACEDYAAARGWTVGGCWVDRGEHALIDGCRPVFDALLRSMRVAGGCRPRVLLVHDWSRLSRDQQAKGAMARRVLVIAGAWLETSSGETLTADGRQRLVGRPADGPVTA